MTDYELIDAYVNTLVKEGKDKFPDAGNGHSYALGYMSAKLGGIMFRLKSKDSSELYLELVEEMKDKIDGTS